MKPATAQTPLRLIVVDDDRISLKFVSRTLARDPVFQITELESGRAAIEAIDANPPDILITDWMMPEIDGLELCRQVRAASTREYVYIILLTAKTQPEDILTGLAAGADDYVAKPFNQDELVARVRAGVRVVLGQKALATANAELRAAMAQIKTLTGLLPVCMDCKKVRDDKDYWHDIEEYLRQHTDVLPSHGLCPDCMARRMTELEQLRKQGKTPRPRS